MVQDWSWEPDPFLLESDLWTSAATATFRQKFVATVQVVQGVGAREWEGVWA